MKSYAKVITELESRPIMPDRAPSLDQTRTGLKRLSLTSKIDPDRVVLVAGTNGKGSVASSLSQLIVHAGKSCGLYTSPHLMSTTERIKINHEDISEKDFVAAYLEVESKTSDLNLTHFEMLTLMAVWVFFEVKKCDWAIFEVGLGGIWDATNAIDHKHSIVTTISYDHEHILGNSLTEIAKNKFGIIHEGGNFYHLPLPQEIDPLIKTTESLTRCVRYEFQAFPYRIQMNEHEPCYIIQTPWGESQLSLLGKRAVENVSLSLQVFDQLGFDVTQGLKTLSSLNWPGRMEKLSTLDSPCPVYLSGDHNPQGVTSLAEILSQFDYETVYLLIGIGENKDKDQMFSLFEKIPRSQLVLTKTPFKGIPIENYGAWLHKAFFSHENSFIALSEILKNAKKSDIIVVTGSLYLVGDIRKESFHGKGKRKENSI